MYGTLECFLTQRLSQRYDRLLRLELHGEEGLVSEQPDLPDGPDALRRHVPQLRQLPRRRADRQRLRLSGQPVSAVERK